MKLPSMGWSVMGFLALCIGVLWGYGYYLIWDVQRWDKKIDALCTANGGRDVATRVYETAEAPHTPEYFTEGKVMRTLGVVERPEGVTYGPEYPYVIETRVVETLNQKDPSVVKYTARLVRVRDNKILAERFGYQRAGGGIELWDPSEIRNCPKDRTEDRLEVRVFTNHPLHKKLEQK